MFEEKTLSRRMLVYAYRKWIGAFASFGDRLYLNHQTPAATLARHDRLEDYLEKTGNRKGMRILEIGSREVCGKSSAHQRFAEAEYIGFDYYPGPNVDVVGDAHRLSSYFPGQQFDLIYSFAVFEHLAMPWVVATEIAKLLKVGGIVVIETHFSYGSHERPWHFFQFSDMALRVLFSPALGFECLDAGVSNPMVGRFSAQADPYLRYQPIAGLYCHSGFIGRKTREVESFGWDQVQLAELVAGTHYPPPH